MQIFNLFKSQTTKSSKMRQALVFGLIFLFLGTQTGFAKKLDNETSFFQRVSSKIKESLSSATLSISNLRIEDSMTTSALFTAPVVTNTLDSGLGSFRDAVAFANANPGTTITFNIPISDPGYQAATQHWVIQPLNSYVITGANTTIDGISAAGASCPNNLKIEFDGSTIVTTGNNSIIRLGAVDCTIQGILTNNAPAATSGLSLTSTGGWVKCCFSGTDITGTIARPNTYDGVIVNEGGHTNIIGTNSDGVDDDKEGNLFSGNSRQGVALNQTRGNIVAGNLVGTDVTGTADLGNAVNGVSFTGSRDNLVGTDGNGTSDVLERNIISGNDILGVSISQTGGFNNDNNTIAGNYIGLDISGLNPIPNAQAGVQLWLATNNIVGTNGDGNGDDIEGNVISGNSGFGVRMINAGCNNNTVAGNIIGLNAAGTSKVQNLYAGMRIDIDASNNIIGTNGDGTSDSFERNIISGNNQHGINVLDRANSNHISGNYIGTDITGLVNLGNGQEAIRIEKNSDNNTVGGTTSVFGNVIAGNGSEGVEVISTYTEFTTGMDFCSGTKIQNNRIGLDASSNPMPNGGHGILLQLTGNNTVTDNTVSRNGIHGILATGSEALINDNLVEHNNYAGIVANRYRGDSNPEVEAVTPDDVLTVATISGNTINENCSNATVCAGIFGNGNTSDPINSDKGATSAANNTIGTNNGFPDVLDRYRGTVEIINSSGTAFSQTGLVLESANGGPTYSLDATTTTPAVAPFNGAVLHGPSGMSSTDITTWHFITDFIVDESGTGIDYMPISIKGTPFSFDANASTDATDDGNGFTGEGLFTTRDAKFTTVATGFTGQTRYQVAQFMPVEFCNNGMDDDGDGQVDCADDDCYLAANSGGIDSDNDGIANTCDLDDDNDGILDTDECRETILLPSGTNPSIATPLSGSQTFDYSSPTRTYTYTVSVDNPGLMQSNANGFFNVGLTAAESVTTTINFDSGALHNVQFEINDIDYREGVTIIGYMGNKAVIPTYDLTLTTSAFPDPVVVYIEEGSNGVTFLADILNVNSPSTINGRIPIIFNEPIDKIEMRSFNTPRVSTGDTGTALFDKFTASCDTDGDGTPDLLDPDSDNDGCADALEAGHTDPDGNGVLGTSPVAVSPDGTVSGQGGYTGTDASVTDFNLVSTECDTDDDGVNPVVDLDDDNDGILDTDECYSIDVIYIPNEAAIPPVATGTAWGSNATRSFSYTHPSNGQVFTYDITTNNPSSVNIGANMGISNAIVTSSPGQEHIYTIDITSGAENNVSLTILDTDGNPSFREAARVIGYFGTTPVTPTMTVNDAGLKASYLPSGEAQVESLVYVNTSGYEGVATFNQPIDRIVYTRFHAEGSATGGGVGAVLRGELVCDSDNDGTPDHLDPDSDNDGCADALEAGHTDPDGNGVLGTSPVAVNPDGTVSGQGGYTGTDASVTDFNLVSTECDTDDDGINPVVDLDDDNDGILDTDECNSGGALTGLVTPESSLTTISTPTTFTVTNDNGGTSTFDISGSGGADWDDVTVDTDATAGIHIFATQPSGTTPISNFTTYTVNIDNIQATSGSVEGITLTSNTADWESNLAVHGASNGNRSTFTVNWIGGGLASFTNPDASTFNTAPADGASFVPGQVFEYASIVQASTEEWRIHIPATATNISITWENIGTSTSGGTYHLVSEPMGLYVEICGDTDGDNIADHLDPDSDNDGCADALEAGHTDPDGDGILGTSPVTVDAQGLVTSQGGYTGTDASVTDLGIRVACGEDLDKDNDGILDTDECPFVDIALKFNSGVNNEAIGDADTNWDVQWIAGPDINYAPPLGGTVDAIISGNLAPGTWIDSQDGSQWMNYDFSAIGSGPPNNQLGTHRDADTDGNLDEGQNNPIVSGTGDGVAIKFINTFNIPTGLESTFELNFDVATDNGITDIIVNGVSQGGLSNNFLSYTNVNLDSDWQAGANTVEINTRSLHPIMGFIVSNAKVPCDTDGDGIPNHLDPDSDNDGCSDAQEAGHTDPDGDGILGTSPITEDADGLVENEGGYTGTNANVTDFNLVSVECDTDGDGINPMVDLDDDNDGIKDTEECGTPVQWNTGGTITGGADSGVDQSATLTGNGATANLTITTDSGLFRNYGGSDYMPFNETLAANGKFTIASDKPFFNPIIPLVSLGWKTTVSESVRLGNFTVTYFDNTSQSNVDFIVSDDAALKAFNVTNVDLVTKVVEGGIYYAVDPTNNGNTGEQGYGMVELIGLAPEKGIKSISFDVVGDGQGLTAYFGLHAILCDTDNDGTPDYLDTDSDNDGCADALEAGHTDPDGDGILGTSPVTVDAQGLVTSQGGYTGTNPIVTNFDFVTAECDTDDDGINPVVDLDDDNDGILDTDECYSISSNLITSEWTPESPVTFPEGYITTNDTPFTFTHNDAASGNSLVMTVWSTDGNAGVIPGGNTTGLVFRADGLGVGDATNEGASLCQDYGYDEIQKDECLSFTFDKHVSLNGANFNGFAGATDYQVWTIKSPTGIKKQFTLKGGNNNIPQLDEPFDLSIGDTLTICGTQDITANYVAPGYLASGFCYADGLLKGFVMDVCNDTDSDGTPDHLDTDSDADGCFDAAESGHGQDVSGDGTIAGAYGNNGLATSVESDDTDAATVNYTIQQTNAGTNDFQDANVTGCNKTIAENDINQTPFETPVSGNILTNDYDEEDDNQEVTGVTDSANNSLTVDGTTSNTLPSGSTIVINTDGSYTYTPATGFTGTETLTYEVCDDVTPKACDIATLTIEVLPEVDETGANNPPVAQDDTNTVEQGGTVTSVILTNDSDPDGDVLTVTSAIGLDMAGMPFTLTTTPTDIYDETGKLAGQVSIDASGNVIFTAATNFVGDVPVNYTISDGNGGTDTAVLTITVDPSDATDNDTYANDDASTGLKGEDQTGSVATNDNDPESNNQLISAGVTSNGTPIVPGTEVSLPSGGKLTLNDDGTYVYTPNPNFVGTEVVEYTTCDDGSPQACDTATLYLTTLDNPNTTNAENDINQTPEGIPVNGDVLVNDTDDEGHNATVTGGTDSSGTPITVDGSTPNTLPSGGILVINTDGSYTYTPATGFTGEEVITYEKCDEGSPQACETATLTIEVISTLNEGTLNNPPVAQDDTNTVEQGGTVTSIILSNDSDPDGDVLTVTSATGLDMAGMPFTLTVTPTDIYDDFGNLAGQASIDTNGDVIFTAAVSYVGDVPVEYTISDPDGETDTAILTITVEPADAGDNDVYANDDANSGPQGDPMTGDTSENDNDPDTHSFMITSAETVGGATVNIGSSTTLPSGGTLVLNANGTYDYLPSPTFVGTEVIEYTICDTGLPQACDTATLYLTTLGSNTTNAEDDIANTPYGVPVSGDVLVNDNDEEGNIQTVTIGATMPATEGTVTLNTDGTYTFVPAPGFSGETSFEYEACDNGSPVACDIATVYIEVLEEISSAGQMPIANPDVNQVESGVTATGDILSNDFDPDATPTAVTGFDIDTDGDGIPDTDATSSIGTPINVSGTDLNGNPVLNAGSFTLNADGTYTFVPSPGFIGMVNIDYVMTDENGTGDSDDSVLMIEVLPPTADNMTFTADDALVTDAGVTTTGNIIGNDYDPEGDVQTVNEFGIDTNGDGMIDDVGTIGDPTTISGIDSDGNIVPNAGTITILSNGTYTFVPTAGFAGNAVVPYEACDDNTTLGIECSSATLNITVLDAKRDYGDAPVAYPEAWHRAIVDGDSNGTLDGSPDVWLGMKTTFETSGLVSSNATGDASDDAMIFGTGTNQFPTAMTASTNYGVQLTVNSTQSTTVHYGMWIDYDEDGTYDQFYNGNAITSSPAYPIVNITTPPTLAASGNIIVNVRLRVDDSPLTAADFEGGKTNGEVEDFQTPVSLPVELESFTGVTDDCDVNLKWVTSSEENNSYFQVEHSSDGSSFRSLGQVTGNGNSAATIVYGFVHNTPAKGGNYYRLKQVDYDGGFEYSEVIRVIVDCETSEVKMYPNPAMNRTAIEFQNGIEFDKDGSLILIDVTGRLVKNIPLDGYYQKIDLDISGLPGGAYYVKVIQGSGELFNERLVKVE